MIRSPDRLGVGQDNNCRKMAARQANSSFRSGDRASRGEFASTTYLINLFDNFARIEGLTTFRKNL
jgi:hypothetical protein